MGGNTAEIIARLTLNGSQFSAENQRLFGAMEAQARDTAARTKSAFEGSFREIQQVASRALSMPRNAGGSLNLDVSGARAAAAADEARAIALREVASAAERAAASSGDHSEATRTYVQAARAAAVEAEHMARSSVQQVSALERIQSELNQTKSATDAVILGNRQLNAVHGQGAESANRLRAGYQQLSFQIGDVAQQLALGTNPAVVFGQQFGQIIQALQLMGEAAPAAARGADAVTAATAGNTGATGANTRAHRANAIAIAESATAAGVDAGAQAADAAATNANTGATTGLTAAKARLMGFLAGPWGAAMVGGITVLGLMGSKLFNMSNELEKATKELEENRKKTEAATEAKRAFERTTPGLVAAVKETTEAIEKQNRTLEDNIRLTIGGFRGQRKTAADRRGKIPGEYQATQRELDDTQTRLRTIQSVPGDETTAAAVSDYLAEISRLEQKLRDLKEEAGGLDNTIVALDRAIRLSEFPLIERQAKEANDPLARINGQYQRMIEAQRKLRAEGKITADELLRQETAILAKRDAVLEAEEKRRQKARKDDREEERTISLLAPVDGGISSGYGPRKRPKPGASAFHPAVDFPVAIGTGVRAGAAGVVVKTGRHGGLGNVVWIDYGNNVVAEFNHLSEILVQRGDAVDRGQVVARSGNTGISTGPHLDYRLKVKGSYVNPLGARVNVGKGSGDALADFERDQARELEREAEERDRILASSREQLSIEAETARFTGLRVRGLDREAALQEEIARVRRDGAEDLAKLGEDERKISAGLNEQLRRYQDQAGVFSELMTAHGERATLTEAEAAAEAQAAEALAAQLDAALALAKTTEDRLRIEEAIVRVRHRLNNTEADVEKSARAMEAFRRKEEEAWERQQKDEEERRRDSIEDLADFYERAFRSGGKSIWEDFKDEGFRVMAMIAAQWTMSLLSGQKASLPGILSQIGATSNAGGGFSILSMFGIGGGPGGPGLPGFGGGMFGGGGSNPATRMAELEKVVGGLQDPGAGGAGGLGGLMGSAGQAMPLMAAGMAVTSMLSDVLGIKNHAGGMFGILGNLAINAITPAKRGSATLGFDQFGALGATASRGNSSKRVDASKDAVGSIGEALQRIAEQLDGDLSGAPSVSIGMRDKSWRVDPTGRGITKTKNGAIDFGEDQEAAIRYAIGEALRDGVIAGISDASKRILASGQELERAIEKAALIEAIPRELAERLDPVGAELDKLNQKWTKTIAALKEGGASAEQMADAQKLYKIELEETKAAARDASAGLKDFLQGLNVGPASPYSLRDQEAMARASLQPFLDKIAAGETIDQAKFQDSAKGFLDIERELYGSTGKFFEAMDMVQAATSSAISTIDNAKPIRTVADPFIEATAKNTESAAYMLEDLRDRATAGNELLGQILGAMSGGGDGFIGAGRGFVARSAY